MPYTVVIPTHVAHQLRRLPHAEYPVVRAAIRLLGQNPRPPGCIRLSGSPDWRIRVGDYRVIYAIDDSSQTVTIIDLGNRRDVYR